MFKNSLLRWLVKLVIIIPIICISANFVVHRLVFKQEIENHLNNSEKFINWTVDYLENYRLQGKDISKLGEAEKLLVGGIWSYDNIVAEMKHNGYSITSSNLEKAKVYCEKYGVKVK